MAGSAFLWCRSEISFARCFARSSIIRSVRLDNALLELEEKGADIRRFGWKAHPFDALAVDLRTCKELDKDLITALSYYDAGQFYVSLGLGRRSFDEVEQLSVLTRLTYLDVRDAHASPEALAEISRRLPDGTVIRTDADLQRVLTTGGDWLLWHGSGMPHGGKARILPPFDGIALQPGQ